MKTILVVDDMPIIRDPIAAMLGTAGYRALSAGNGSDALTLVRSDGADLILLDVTMPGMDGLTFLRRLRSDPTTAKIPVIMLSGEEDREDIVRAGKLGIQGYVLKSSFSLKDLLQRVRNQMEAKPLVAPADSSTKQNSGQPATFTGTNTRYGSGIPRMGYHREAELACGGAIAGDRTRFTCARPDPDARGVHSTGRAALQGKTLSGVAAQVISMAASPRGEIGDLATLVSRDAMLTARILQAANSAVYRTARPASTVADAVRQIGFSGVRNIAASIGIYDAMPVSSADGFNPLLCWRHSFAVATLCERLAAAGGSAPA